MVVNTYLLLHKMGYRYPNKSLEISFIQLITEFGSENNNLFWCEVLGAFSSPERRWRSGIKKSWTVIPRNEGDCPAYLFGKGGVVSCSAL